MNPIQRPVSPSPAHADTPKTDTPAPTIETPAGAPRGVKNPKVEGFDVSVALFKTAKWLQKVAKASGSSTAKGFWGPLKIGLGSWLGIRTASRGELTPTPKSAKPSEKELTNVFKSWKAIIGLANIPITTLKGIDWAAKALEIGEGLGSFANASLELTQSALGAAYTQVKAAEKFYGLSATYKELQAMPAAEENEAGELTLRRQQLRMKLMEGAVATTGIMVSIYGAAIGDEKSTEQLKTYLGVVAASLGLMQLLPAYESMG